MSENVNTIDQAALSALDSGMSMTKQFDSDLARDMAKDLLAKFPQVVTGLPNDVSALLIDTSTEQARIPRAELQSIPFTPPDKPVAWTWGQVYAYYYTPR